jgi:hypothetical protein
MEIITEMNLASNGGKGEKNGLILISFFAQKRLSV